nr:PREDICTED: RNA-binding protein 42 [Bemisia tabaci]
MASVNNDKLKMMEDEMNRFEEEISIVPPPPPPPPFIPAAVANRMVIGTNTYNQVQNQLDAMPPRMPFPGPMDPMSLPPGPPGPPRPPMAGNFGPGPPPLFPPGPGPMGFPPNFPEGPPMMPPNMPPNMMGPNHGLPDMMGPPGFGNGPPGFFPPPPPAFVKSQIEEKKAPVVLSGAPKLYNAKSKETDKKDSAEKKRAGPAIVPSQVIKSDIDGKKPMKSVPKTSAKEMAAAVQASQTVVTQQAVDVPAATPAAPGPSAAPKKKEKDNKKQKKVIRTAGGVTWEDNTLTDWPDDDFRLFCGDLGNDVTDEVLIRAFSKYPSFQRARVVRDRRTNKTKGFGFVSFADPQDFIKATKEMNGRYVGSRPIKLRKSTWRNRNLDIARKKEKEKQALIGLLTGH